MNMVPAVGFVELLLVLIMGGSLPLGLPPGPMDAALQRTPPDGCVVYVEWAARSAGQPGAPGVDGLVADPEVQEFVRRVEQTIRGEFDQNIPNADGREAAHAAVDLTLQLLVRPGCLFVSFDTTDLPPREDFPNFAHVFHRLKVGLIFNAGDQADAVQEALTKVFAKNGIEFPAEIDRFSLPIPVPGGGVTLHRAGERFIVSYGQGTLDTSLAGLAGEREGLLADARIAAALQSVAVDRPAQRSWLDVKGILTAADRVAGGQAMIAETVGPLGLDAVDHIVSSTGVHPQTGQIVSRTHGATNGLHRGLLALFAGRPLTVADFAHIPADSDFYLAQSLNHVQILDAVRDIVHAADATKGEQFDAGLKAADEALGLSIRDDLLAGFGDVWTLYDSPANGGVLFSAPVLCLEVRDHAKASAAFLRWIELIEANLPGEQFGDGRRSRGVFLASEEFVLGKNSHAIAFINITGQDDEPFAPSFCLTKSHLLVALHPQPLKGHLRFVDAAQAAIEQLIRADHPLRTRKLLQYSRIDTAAALRYFVATLPYFGQMLASELQGQRVDINVFAIPSARGLLPYLSDTTSWIEVTEQGITLEGASGIVIPGFSGGTALLPLGMFSVRAAHIP